MAFDTYENSNFDGTPVRLYEIKYGNDVWRYNSSDRDLTVGGVVYASAAISDDGFVQSGEATAETLTITCPTNLEIVRRYRGTPPSSTVIVILRQIHYDDTGYIGGSLSSVPILWQGELSAVREEDEAQAKLTANMLTISLKRGGLRLGWQRPCPHFVYDANCRVNKASFAVAVTGTINATKITVVTSLSGYAANYFDGGFVEWTDPATGTVERRGIELQDGAVLNLLGTIDNIEGESASFTIYPGCRRVIDYCDSVFNNRHNYGGVPGLPGRSPFDGNPIY
jgi:uncharacterized phage protein (TIGR02218 family)